MVGAWSFTFLHAGLGEHALMLSVTELVNLGHWFFILLHIRITWGI